MAIPSEPPIPLVRRTSGTPPAAPEPPRPRFELTSVDPGPHAVELVASALDEQQRNLTVQMRQLREPRQLTERAAELGFGRPDRVIDLPGDERDEHDRLARSTDSAELRP